MPARNSRKQYLENGYYHIYNRGVEKRTIFLDEQDYNVFLSYLKEYLLPKNEKELYERLSDPDISPKEKDKILKLLRMNNFVDEITLISYTLKSNHFHFCIKQKSAGSIDKFMNSLGTRYTMYFNRKYKRVGSLYQDVYKAVLIKTSEQLLHLTRYIHKQDLQGLALQGDALQGKFSSYSDFVGIRKTEWVHPEEILSFFSETNTTLSYKSFVEREDDINMIANLIIEDID
ncbi:MAG: transposase [Candidatus Levybacteria bacterium]|nr:transposase [Candidatus Levybacteria bacterium]